MRALGPHDEQQAQQLARRQRAPRGPCRRHQAQAPSASLGAEQRPGAVFEDEPRHAHPEEHEHAAEQGRE